MTDQLQRALSLLMSTHFCKRALARGLDVIDIFSPQPNTAEDFGRDPDRYVAALAMAFCRMGLKQQGAIEVAIACLEGFPGDAETLNEDGASAGVLEFARKRCRRGADAERIARAMIAIWRSRGFTDEDIAKFPEGWRWGGGDRFE
jgi:hypothetical protein